jgi:hypothetical protein
MRMLEQLADIIPSSQPQLNSAIEKSVQVVGRGQDLLIISPRSLEEAQQESPGLARCLAPWMRTGSLRWIDVSGDELDRWVVPARRESSAVDPDEPSVNTNTTDNTNTNTTDLGPSEYGQSEDALAPSSGRPDP